MELLTVQETAELLRVSSATVRRYIAAGALPARRVGRNMCVEKDEAERFAQSVANSHIEDGTNGGSAGRPRRRRKSSYLTYDDPIWLLAGIFGEHDGPTDVARDKYKYLVEEYGKGLSFGDQE